MRARTKAALAAPAVAAWTAQLLADRRAIGADPARDRLEAPLTGQPLEVVSADGTRLHAEVFGPEGAPPIVLAHGWTCSLRYWVQQIHALSTEHRVIAYDQRGHGRSGRPAGGRFDVAALGEDLDAVLDAAAPGERPLVAGHSMGGMSIVAWAAMREDPVSERIAAAALVCTGMGDLITETLLVPGAHRLGPRLQRAVGRRVLSAKAPLPKGSTPISHRAVRYIALGPDATPAQVAFSERLVLQCHRSARGGWGGALAGIDQHDAVASLDVPAVVIAGASDRLTPPSHAARMASALPQLEELVVLDGVGHMGGIEAPDEVTSRLRALARFAVPVAAAS